MSGPMILRAATRGSALALWQTAHVAELVGRLHPHVAVEPVIVSTGGDRDKTTPIHELGGKGVFVKEVQAAVLEGRADIAVHSAKDLPALTPPGLHLAAVPERADARDAIVGARIDELRPGALVGTGSVRRRVQLAGLRPDVEVVELRGNIDTRLARLDELDAVLMAAAALDRLGRDAMTIERLDVERMIPQVGQGALAVEVRRDDERATAVIAGIEHSPSRRTVDAERAFLVELGGDCDLPAGAHATIDGDGVELRAMLADPDGRRVLTARESARDGAALGARVAGGLRERLGS